MEHKATFAAGCFWGVEETFRTFPGVLQTQVGYTGGRRPHPTYEQVCTGATGHAEAVEVIFDEEQVSYRDLLRFFWKIHDPTTWHRQGPDIGSQYRSAVFYHNDVQKNLALEVKAELENEGIWGASIVTEIVEAREFFPAEDYHQRYFEKRGGGSCHIRY